MLKKVVIVSSLITAAISLSACQSDTIQITQNDNTITLLKAPEKVVVMDFGVLDTLDAFGLNNTVVGLPKQNIPDYLNQYTSSDAINTGTMKEPDFEAITETKPDLIIISPRLSSSIDKLSQIAPVINMPVSNKDYFSSVKSNITLLGQVTNNQDKAAQNIAQLEQKIAEAKQVTTESPVNAIVALHNNGRLMLTNQSTYAALIHDVLGVKRAVAILPLLTKPQPGERPKPTLVDNQYIQTLKPGIVFVIDRSEAIGQKAMADDFFDTKILEQTGTKVVHLTADLWYLSGAGVESTNLQIDEVTTALK
ncbi:siderophore ABC transporter substrate-binding protein [Zophobihabitans entericus]|uniref:ABC transporter substrate-binding protein n=1 Tax=Zophobihabitans entericus TaxID=1635327 RepID=A0A6G9ICS4_9GAMM|nr:ABC transporter substrate-binding protein [Zophobihabitans entericus]QIQ21504.1 ABC transporter substrate-binding protein [Zophobihabitans entericus]